MGLKLGWNDRRSAGLELLLWLRAGAGGWYQGDLVRRWCGATRWLRAGAGEG